MTFDLDIMFVLTIFRPSLKVKVVGQISRPQNENVPFSATDARFGKTIRPVEASRSDLNQKADLNLKL